MKKITFIMALCVTSLTFGQIIADGGFETIGLAGETNVAIGSNGAGTTDIGFWHATTATLQPRSTVVSSNADAGTYALELDSSGGAAKVNQNVILEANTTYTCSYRVRKVNANVGDDEKALVFKVVANAGGNNGAIQNVTDGGTLGFEESGAWKVKRSDLSTTEYKSVSFEFTTGDDTAYYLAIALQPDSAGSPVLLDEISIEVTDVSNLPPILSTRLTENFPIEMPQLHAYPIYINAKMSGQSDLAVNNVNIEIDGTSFNLGNSEGDYTFWWTPSGYGVHTINITASGSNGSSASITRNMNVTNTINSQTVTTMQDVVIEFNGTNSRWFKGTYTLPQHVGSYDKIIAKLTVECPSATGNCDDWDRKGYINIKAPDGNWIELIRYMTPYNVGCNHEIDVTDYASLLQGEFEIQMFIDTWGSGGWQITLDFEYQQGTPEYLYSEVEEIWDGTFPLGNPTNLQPVPTINYEYNNNIVNSHLRLMTTGHGWGQNNSQNAAEFYDAINFIDVDGNEIFEQDIEKTCNPNPDNCLGQQGTWYYSRAGWCPGAIARPDIIDLTSKIGNNPIALAYRFDPTYIDECHPNNPDCVSGVTCPDCDDNFAAIYLIDAQIINFSNTPILDQTLGLDFVDNTLEYNLKVFPNPSKGTFNLNVSNLTGGSIVSIHNISGQTIKNYLFEDAEHLNTYVFNMEGYPTGVYFISLESNAGTGHIKLIIK